MEIYFSFMFWLDLTSCLQLCVFIFRMTDTPRLNCGVCLHLQTTFNLFDLCLLIFCLLTLSVFHPRFAIMVFSSRNFLLDSGWIIACLLEQQTFKDFLLLIDIPFNNIFILSTVIQLGCLSP